MSCHAGNCSKPVVARGYCIKHYQQARATGEISKLPLTPAVERFWAKVDKNGPVPEERPDLGQCWVWRGSIQKGYGRFRTEGKVRMLAHRYSYEELVGTIPGDLTLDHLCRNRSCVNPGHLEAVTRKENIMRGEGACVANARKTHCPQKHEYTAENTWRDGKGRRRCRKCLTERQRKARAAKRHE